MKTSHRGFFFSLFFFFGTSSFTPDVHFKSASHLSPNRNKIHDVCDFGGPSKCSWRTLLMTGVPAADVFAGGWITQRRDLAVCTIDSGSDADSPLISSFHRQGCVLSVVCAHPPHGWTSSWCQFKFHWSHTLMLTQFCRGFGSKAEKKRKKQNPSGTHFLVLGHKAEPLFSLWWCQKKVLQAAATLHYSLFLNDCLSPYFSLFTSQASFPFFFQNKSLISLIFYQVYLRFCRCLVWLT